ncbi:hypothetical protein [Microcoleus sp. herbarium7]|uniref:hypothetical protein n=1 Tax=Microcoleus sp. herbarium7 TaxID=3055435 RepID=UPI002FD4F5D3
MFTSLTETNPASEYRNPPSRSSVFNGCSINFGRYLISSILAVVELILRKSNSESIGQISSALQKYASILREIDKVCIISSAGSDYLKPSKTQMPKWQSPLSENSGLGSCYAGRDSDTLSSGGKCDRLFANKESNETVNHQVAIAFPTPQNQVCYRFGQP